MGASFRATHLVSAAPYMLGGSAPHALSGSRKKYREPTENECAPRPRTRVLPAGSRAEDFFCRLLRAAEQTNSPRAPPRVRRGPNAANIMYDKRVVRGNTYAAQILPATAQAEQLEMERQAQRTHNTTKKIKTVGKPSTPEPSRFLAALPESVAARTKTEGAGSGGGGRRFSGRFAP